MLGFVKSSSLIIFMPDKIIMDWIYMVKAYSERLRILYIFTA